MRTCNVCLIIMSLSIPQASRKNSGGDFGGAYKASKQAEFFALWSYRVSVFFFVILGILVIGGITGAICIAIDAVHISRPV